MLDEIQKLEQYLDEACRVWSINPQFVVSLQFFELWEESQQPAPFRISSPSLSIGGHTVDLSSDQNLVGCVCWDTNEECCCLRVEGDKTLQSIYITFDDGAPNIAEPVVSFVEDTELSYGERLEFIYDLIARLRARNPSLNLHDITRQEFLLALPEMETRYPRQTMSVMRQQPLRAVTKLIQKAMEDMAADEISNQLVLPLDGTYASSGSSDANSRRASFHDDQTETSFPAFRRRSRWSILFDLQFIQTAYSMLAEFESTFLIAFRDSQILSQPTPSTIIVKVPLQAALPLYEGSRLPVQRRDSREAVGAFLIDFHDGDAVVGKLVADEPISVPVLRDQWFARNIHSPTKFLSTLCEGITAKFAANQVFDSPLLGAILGLTEFRLTDAKSPSNFASELDRSQDRARANAVNDQNCVVVIQGPPGTGKTHVLEQTIRDLYDDRRRILMTAPSNTAVDNVCRRIHDLPVLRVGKIQDSIAPDVADTCWVSNPDAVTNYKQKKTHRGSVYCGTHVGILRDDLVLADLEQNGLYDVIIFDEAGMASMIEFLLCLRLARRAVLFGDHQQLPPFPLPDQVTAGMLERRPAQRRHWSLLTRSALEWLIRERQVFPYLLQSSYRCQNPRLLRFSSTLFYNARVKTSERAEYFQLPFHERQAKFPPATLRLYRTNQLPVAVRGETLVVEGKRPGIENLLEARLTVHLFYELLADYPMEEITIIAPYRRQVNLIRSQLSLAKAQQLLGGESRVPEARWEALLFSRISTVDSFQGGESDAVIISYVRSNNGAGVGFVDNPNRINVTHTRCRKAMIIIGDFGSLQRQSKSHIFQRMERAIERDGEVIDVTMEMVQQLGVQLAQEQALLL